MGHSYSGVGGFGDFTVTVTNPSGNIVRFTLSDSTNKVTQIRLVQAILRDAIVQWLATNRAALDTNGDTAVVGPTEYYPGDGFAAFTYVYGSKYAQVTLSDIADVDVSETLTVSIPYADITG